MASVTDEVRECTRCGRVLPATTEFFKRAEGTRSGLSGCCRQCTNDRQNASRRGSHVAATYQAWREQGCVRCGCKDWRVIEAHHVNRQWKRGSAGVMAQARDLEALLRELEKCVPLCANCHVLVHHHGASLWD